MKIILSRKGVDSSAGGFASPIFPDGRMISIPIPDKRAAVRYRDIRWTAKDKHDVNKDRSIGKLVKDLSGGKMSAHAKVHVDPDLDSDQLARNKDWQPLFGQCGAAQTHLHSLGVDRGDLFLFFGWFRQVESYRRRWRYVSGAPNLHVLFGWMQIEAVEPVETIIQSEKSAWMRYHPHCLAEFGGSNVIYRGRRQLSMTSKGLTNKGSTGKRVRGAGVFTGYRDELCLTEPGCSRSRWRLPGWMHPSGRRSVLSYHSDPARWQTDSDYVRLRSAARGQEFVLDLDDYPEGVKWVRGLLEAH